MSKLALSLLSYACLSFCILLGTLPTLDSRQSAPFGTSSILPFSTHSSPTSPSPRSPQTLQDMNTVLQRRLGFIIASATQASQIASWQVDRALVLRTHLTFYLRLQTLGPDGSWPASEIDYTTGCPARRANWPASNHWARIRMYTS
jgi:hypothetical protein